MINRLFVYGTLAPNQENEHFLKPLHGDWQTAWVRGVIYPQGLPTTEGYPALRLNDQSPYIQGLMFSSNELTTIWPQLDAFEGEGYARLVTTARLSDGSETQTYTYAYNELFSNSHHP
jgi:gamma-glutamylcyclotransferase (GGCT)/AIG2-like uncharacterized protein YtfP